MSYTLCFQANCKCPEDVWPNHTCNFIAKYTASEHFSIWAYKRAIHKYEYSLEVITIVKADTFQLCCVQLSARGSGQKLATLLHMHPGRILHVLRTRSTEFAAKKFAAAPARHPSGERDLGPARGACPSPLRIHARSSANSSLTCGDAFVRPTASHISWVAVAVLTFAAETCGIWFQLHSQILSLHLCLGRAGPADMLKRKTQSTNYFRKRGTSQSVPAGTTFAPGGHVNLDKTNFVPNKTHLKSPYICQACWA